MKHILALRFFVHFSVYCSLEKKHNAVKLVTQQREIQLLFSHTMNNKERGLLKLDGWLTKTFILLQSLVVPFLGVDAPSSKAWSQIFHGGIYFPFILSSSFQ